MRAITVARYRTQYPYTECICDHGFKWRVYAETSKSENTWCGMLRHYDAEYDTASRIVEGQWLGRHLIRNRNSDGNLYVRYLYWNDGRWNWNYNWLDNDFNGNNPAALLATRLTSLPFRESFVFGAGQSTRRAFCLSPQSLPIMLYTFCYQVILFPRAPSKAL